VSQPEFALACAWPWISLFTLQEPQDSSQDVHSGHSFHVTFILSSKLFDEMLFFISGNQVHAHTAYTAPSVLLLMEGLKWHLPPHKGMLVKGNVIRAVNFTHSFELKLHGGTVLPYEHGGQRLLFVFGQQDNPICSTRSSALA
jgi:hypothetical protein